MGILELILIAIVLSMDSFAISISIGFTTKELHIGKILIVALSLSFFQAMMPVVGWLAGIGLKKHIIATDHWIAFTLLLLIGLKMIYEGLKKRKSEKAVTLSILTLISLSIATSIDALAVGTTFAFLNISIITPVIIIGFVTFVFSIWGLYLSKLYGKRYSNRIEIVGGMILIGLGTKILIEHLYFQ